MYHLSTAKGGFLAKSTGMSSEETDIALGKTIYEHCIYLACLYNVKVRINPINLYNVYQQPGDHRHIQLPLLLHNQGHGCIRRNFNAETEK